MSDHKGYFCPLVLRNDLTILVRNLDLLHVMLQMGVALQDPAISGVLVNNIPEAAASLRTIVSLLVADEPLPNAMSRTPLLSTECDAKGTASKAWVERYAFHLLLQRIPITFERADIESISHHLSTRL